MPFPQSLFRKEKAILVGVEFPKEHLPLSESLEELKRLAETAGAEVCGELSQKRKKPDLKYFIGTGKIVELQSLVATRGTNLVIFDHELNPAQERNLEDSLGVKIIDRTELILDIFAQHAHSREGALQVELAQSQFLLTRLTGQGILMSRLAGGIGTRGPGETKLEYDRRQIRKRISELKEELEKVRKERAIKREKRRTSQITVAAIVGYTNSGKSTLLNALTKAQVLVEDKLFATLDPTTRRMYLPGGEVLLLTDTVGFIQKLPHPLVAAFRATLEEVSEADFLLHVVDVSHPYFEDQIEAVYQVLEELNCIAKPIITIFNKIDRLNHHHPGVAAKLKKLLKKYKPAVALSALANEGIKDLLKIIAAEFMGRVFFFGLLFHPGV